MTALEIRRSERGRVQILLRATLGDDLLVRLVGLPEWVASCERVGDQTVQDGIWYLHALRDAFSDGRLAVAYGGAYAEVLS